MTTSRLHRLLCCVFLAGAAVSSVARPIFAQEFRGTILGRITDSAGAAIPGANVAAINERTNVVSKAVTADDGAYNVPFLIPGTYRVEVDAPGFRRFAQSGINVTVNQKATVNIELQVGAVDQTVTVTADATLLDTSHGGMGQVIDQQKVEALPLKGRNIFILNQVAPGVNWQVPTFGATGTSGLRPFDNLGASAWSMNGGRVTTNEFLLDGAPDSTRGRYNFSPPVDAVREFKVQTNTYEAQYGRTGGGVVNMTLKSGANSFHGQVWEFIQYGAWDANHTVNNASGTFGDHNEIPSTDPRFGLQRRPRPSHQFNQYGTTVSGPIKRDKLFWMFTWEGLRERVPFPITTSVPTAEERLGDFTRSFSDQSTPLVIYDPLTTHVEGGKNVRTAFGGNRLPANRINPIALKVLQLFPLPNVPDQRLNNYVNGENKGRYDYNAELTRIDYQLSDKSKLFGTFYRNHRNEFRSNNGLQGTFANQGQWPQTRNNHGATVDWVYSVNAKSLLNLRAGFTRFLETAFQTDVKKFDRGQLGFQNLPGEFLPRIDFQQFSGIGVGSEGRGTVDNTGSLQANYTRNFEHHNLKFGGEYRNIRSNPTTTGNSNGFFNFTKGFTQKDANTADSSSGNSIASFLLGYPASGNVGAAQARAEQWNYTAFFVQDDFRVTPKLTLNIGLRWDYEGPATERFNRLVRGFDFNAPSPLADRVKNANGVGECLSCGNLRGGLLFADVGGVSRGLFDPDRNNFQPRFGFAYSIDSKTVMRGGYGTYYLATTQFGPQDGFFVDTNYIAGDINGRVGFPELGVNTFVNPFPNGLRAAPGATAGLLTQVGQGISFDDPNRVIPYIYQYNFGFERELKRNLIVEVSYVGSQTRHLAVGKGINEISAADQARGATFLQQAVPNPFAGLLPGSGSNGATVQRQQLLRPFPQFGGITENSMSIGKSWYNSFQFRVEKRMSNGLSFLSSYTLSKNMEQNNFLNAQDSKMVRQLTDYDRTHRWVLSGVYDLPFGKGRKLLGQTNRVVNHLIGGWQVQGIFTQQSGRPLDQPNLERLKTAKLKDATFDRYFNTCYRDTAGGLKSCLPGEEPVWFQRQPFTLRTTPNRFSDIRVPWKPTLDFSIFKQTKIGEKFMLQYRLEAFNALNTVIYESPSLDSNAVTSQCLVVGQCGNFGKVSQPRNAIYPPRQLQMGLKLHF
ncbi:MAG TPA: carboxypeptidase regulatory-like domain-containing protein [Blastocatellia bacterium]|jgi:hypothetical protein|nr:carboxypeptidase regulatory-like domain-containing protein [Blastocatellia bacterium]